MKLVKFKNGSYGVKKFNFFPWLQYLYKDFKFESCDIWVQVKDSQFKNCHVTEDVAREFINRVYDGGEVVE